MKKESIIHLVDRYLSGTASEAESGLVESFLNELSNGPVRQLSPEEEAAKERVLLNRIYSKIHGRKKAILVSMPKVWKASIAAAAVLIIAVSVWLLYNNKPASKPELAKKDIVAPGSNRAMITLADGRKIYLDSLGNGQLAVEGNVKLIKLADGQIAYQNQIGDIAKEVKYNTLSNPRGSKVIDMQLSDGSHVWLNSGSSITFPVPFIGNERKVMIDGEAYLEVAHDASRPFIVAKGETEVQVLGTHFNVNAYSDEEDIKVTLLEGSVKVNKASFSAIIKPGQQARVRDKIAVVDGVDMDGVMAWKNGLFNLSGENIQTVMRQVSRWYDAEVEYRGDVTGIEFFGTVSRRQNVSELLRVMEKTGIVHFTVEGKKIIVSK